MDPTLIARLISENIRDNNGLINEAEAAAPAPQGGQPARSPIQLPTHLQGAARPAPAAAQPAQPAQPAQSTRAAPRERVAGAFQRNNRDTQLALAAGLLIGRKVADGTAIYSAAWQQSATQRLLRPFEQIVDQYGLQGSDTLIAELYGSLGPAIATAIKNWSATVSRSNPNYEARQQQLGAQQAQTPQAGQAQQPPA